MRPKIPDLPPPENLPQALVVYCFQTTQRSAKGEKIEQWMHEVLDKSFASQLKAHKIVWQVVNFEEPENAASCREIRGHRDGYRGGRRPAGQSGPSHQLPAEGLGVAEDKEAFTKYFCGEIEKALK